MNWEISKSNLTCTECLRTTPRDLYPQRLGTVGCCLQFLSAFAAENVSIEDNIRGATLVESILPFLACMACR